MVNTAVGTVPLSTAAVSIPLQPHLVALTVLNTALRQLEAMGIRKVLTALNTALRQLRATGIRKVPTAPAAGPMVVEMQAAQELRLRQ
mmetsp:Transcript_37658/g.79763  ORF Transcript_37658/g.79763 Transcript_37658/m.79763 type:complete len:88 (-) Transcript_37658:1318-1581(-)